MTEQEIVFTTQYVENGDNWTFVTFPAILDLIPGMKVRNQTTGCEKEFIVLDVVRIPDGNPALVLNAQKDDFNDGDDISVYPGNTSDGTILMQSLDTWLLPERGIVISGTSLGVIKKGGKYILRTETGSEYTCKCLFIERFKDGSGRPTYKDEKGAAILLSVQVVIQGEPVSPKNQELLQIVGSYPSLHLPKKADRD